MRLVNAAVALCDLHNALDVIFSAGKGRRRSINIDCLQRSPAQCGDADGWGQVQGEHVYQRGKDIFVFSLAVGKRAECGREVAVQRENLLGCQLFRQIFLLIL